MAEKSQSEGTPIIAKLRRAKGRKSRSKEPLDVKLSLSFRFGEEPDDVVNMIEQRSVPMVNSVFESRDAILRAFTRLLVKASASQPKVARELIPGLRLLRRNK